jgi:hypothetical protein
VTKFYTRKERVTFFHIIIYKVLFIKTSCRWRQYRPIAYSTEVEEEKEMYLDRKWNDSELGGIYSNNSNLKII